jgi:hypothetical protein
MAAGVRLGIRNLIATARVLRFTLAVRTPDGPVAQWLEPAAHNGLVAGSSPARPTSPVFAIDFVGFLRWRRRLAPQVRDDGGSVRGVSVRPVFRVSAKPTDSRHIGGRGRIEAVAYGAYGSNSVARNCSAKPRPISTSPNATRYGESA